MDENDLVGENYEEDQTCLIPFWLDSNGFCYIPYPLEGVVDIPEKVLDDQEVLNTMPISTETTEQDTQTDEWTQDKSVNTNESWQHLMRALVEQNAELEAACKSLQKQQAAEDVESQNRVKSLEKMRDDKQRQHRALLEKIESVRVKLDLNSSKMTRKNFSVKVEELTAERDQRLETKRRLTQDLEVVDMKLKSLKEEQRNEKSAWNQEITALQHEMDKLSSQVEESNQAALKDEIAALESERELAVSQSEDWIAEAERYLNTLRSDTSPQNRWLRIEWEKNVAEVRQSLSTLQSLYNKNLKLLHGGQQLDNLPKIPLPQFPHIPMFAVSQPPVPLPQFPSVHRSTPPPQNPASFTMPHMLEQTMPVPMPAMPATVHAPSLPYTPPTYQYNPVPPAQVSVPAGLPAAVRAIASVQNSASQALPSNPKPVGKLDKLLEILGTQFPQCTRAQIMAVLQQVKSERGTMGGMSVEDIKLQVEQKLAQNERLPPGPIAPPAGSRHSHRGPVQPALSTHPSLHAPSPHVFQSRGPQAAPSVRKLCLMCQNHVEPGSQYNTNCSHMLHKECISVWLQSSKNNSCPFCPSK